MGNTGTPVQDRRPGLVRVRAVLFAAAMAGALCGCSAGPLASAQAYPDPAIAAAAAAVVRVLERTPRGTQVLGSGIVLGERRVLTAAHVVAGAGPLALEDGFGRSVAVVRILRTDPERDAAWLEFEAPPASGFAAPAPAAAAEPTVTGSTVYALGVRGGAWRSTVTEAAPGAPLFAFHGAARGDSGGAVCDDAGRLVGMTLAHGHRSFALVIAPDAELAGAVAWPERAAGPVEGLLWGVLASRAGRPAEAIAYLDVPCAARRDDASAHFLRARARLDAGDAEGAAREFSALAERRPDDPAVWNNLGLAEAARRRGGEAADALRRALRLDPTDREVRWNLWVVLREHERHLRTLGLEDEADRVRAEARRVGPGAARPPGS